MKKDFEQWEYLIGDMETLSQGNASQGIWLNFLCQKENIYIMDNHFAALWCWVQQIDENQKYNLLHIDMHYDWSMVMCKKIAFKILRQNKEIIKGMNIQDFLASMFIKPYPDTNNDELLLWDTYLPLFNNIWGHLISSYFLFTHQNEDEEEPPKNKKIHKLNFGQICQIIDENLSSIDEKLIVNIDIDYFFIEANETVIQIFTDDYIKEICRSLNKLQKSDKLQAITIALSPDVFGYSGWDWKVSVRIAKLITEELGFGSDWVSMT